MLVYSMGVDVNEVDSDIVIGRNGLFDFVDSSGYSFGIVVIVIG